MKIVYELEVYKLAEEKLNALINIIPALVNRNMVIASKEERIMKQSPEGISTKEISPTEGTGSLHSS